MNQPVAKSTLALKDESALLALAETIPVLIVLIHGDHLAYVNPAACRVLGYTREQMIGRTFWDVVHPESREAAKVRGRARQAGVPQPKRFVERLVHADGHAVWMDYSVDLIELDGKTMTLVTGHDITEQRTMEEHLRQSEARLAEAQCVAHLGSWEWDIANNRVTWSDELYRIYGLSPGRFSASFEGFLSRLHPEDRSVAASIVERALKDGEPFEYEHRVIREDGEVRTLLGRGRVERDAAGRPVRMYGTGQDITERKAVEEAWRQSEQRFRRVYEHSPVMMCTLDAEDRIRDVNDCWLRTLGYAREEVVGRSGFDFVTAASRQRLRETWNAQMRTLANRPVQAIRKDGTVVDLLTTTVPEVDGYGNPCGAICVSIDISALRESEARYRILVECAPDAIIVGDAETGKFVDVNEPTMALFGMSREKLLTLGPVDCSPPIQPNGRLSSELAAEMIERALRGECPVFEWVHVDAKGREFPCRIHLSRMPAAHRNLVRASITDISNEKRLQEQMRHQEKMAAMGLLAAGVAHEIGNPLLALSMAAQSLERKADDPYARKKLALIREHIDRIAKIVRQMNDLARPQSGERTRTCLNRTIERALEVARFDKRAKDVAVTLELGDIPWIVAIEDQLMQVCLNLAFNAFDAMSSNPPSRPRALRISTHADGGRVRAVFEDSGCGIAPGHETRLFKPFFTTKPPGKGTGLGLSVSLRILEEHGGKLRYEPRPEGGARFLIDLPASHAS